MTTSFSLTAQPRTDELGKRPSRRLRREGKVPAVLYGGGELPLHLIFPHSALLKALENTGFYSKVLNIKVGDSNYQAVLKGLNWHPFNPQIMDLDLLRVTESEKITLTVPLHFLGAATAHGVKQEGGVLTYALNSVEVHCLPKQLPEFLEVDVSQLKLNETISLSQIVLPEGVSLIPLMQGEDPAVVTIHPARHQAGTDAEEMGTAAVPATAQKAPGDDK